MKKLLVMLVLLGVCILNNNIAFAKRYIDSNGKYAFTCSLSKTEQNGLIKQCKDIVILNLKCPATAKFSGEEVIDSCAPGEKDVWVVSGLVDAQNSFGALIRDVFSFTVKKDGQGGLYLDSGSLGGEILFTNGKNRVTL